MDQTLKGEGGERRMNKLCLALLLVAVFVPFNVMAEDKANVETAIDISQLPVVHGAINSVNKREFMLIRSDSDLQEACAKASLAESDKPVVDFDKNMALAVFGGTSINSRGIGIEKVTTWNGIFTIYLVNVTYQTVGSGAAGGAAGVNPYGIFVLPKFSGYVIVKQDFGGLSGKRIWKIVKEFKEQ